MGEDHMQALTLTDLDKPSPEQSVIKRLRDHHHRLALLVAQGKRTGEIAAITGMSISRISILKSDPAFKQLVEVYRPQCMEIEFDAYRDVMAKRAAIEYKVLELIEERVDEQDETLSMRDLQELQADMADRLGRAKVSRSESLVLKGDLADSLAVARQREARQLSAPTTPSVSGAETPGSVSSLPAEPPTPAGGKDE